MCVNKKSPKLITVITMIIVINSNNENPTYLDCELIIARSKFFDSLNIYALKLIINHQLFQKLNSDCSLLRMIVAKLTYPWSWSDEWRTGKACLKNHERVRSNNNVQSQQTSSMSDSYLSSSIFDCWMKSARPTVSMGAMVKYLISC